MKDIVTKIADGVWRTSPQAPEGTYEEGNYDYNTLKLGIEKAYNAGIESLESENITLRKALKKIKDGEHEFFTCDCGNVYFDEIREIISEALEQSSPNWNMNDRSNKVR